MLGFVRHDYFLGYSKSFLLGHEARCLCPAGFAGKLCETDIDECASNPCYNGATCIDEPQGYICNCPLGYSGLQCQEEESSCINNTCSPQSMCKNEPGYENYSCLCRSGFTGENCSVTVNPCTENGNPCANEASCVPLQQVTFLIFYLYFIIFLCFIYTFL